MMNTDKTPKIPEDILIKFINADENGPITNNGKRKLPSIKVVIPRDTTQIVVNGYIKKTDNKTYVHYEVSVPQNKNTIPHCKNSLSSKLWHLLRAFVGSRFTKQVGKIYHYLLQNTFEDSIEKGLKILIIIMRIIKCVNYVSHIIDHQNFDWLKTPLSPILDPIDHQPIIAIISKALLWIMNGIVTT